MATIEVSVPEELFTSLHKSTEQIARDVQVAAIVGWYAEGLVSQGKAAELAGLTRYDFLDELARRKVPAIQMTPEELRAELEG